MAAVWRGDVSPNPCPDRPGVDGEEAVHTYDCWCDIVPQRPSDESGNDQLAAKDQIKGRLEALSSHLGKSVRLWH